MNRSCLRPKLLLHSSSHIWNSSLEPWLTPLGGLGLEEGLGLKPGWSWITLTEFCSCTRISTIRSQNQQLLCSSNGALHQPAANQCLSLISLSLASALVWLTLQSCRSRKTAAVASVWHPERQGPSEPRYTCSPCSLYTSGDNKMYPPHKLVWHDWPQAGQPKNSWYRKTDRDSCLLFPLPVSRSVIRNLVLFVVRRLLLQFLLQLHF